MPADGATRWIIPDGYLPSGGEGLESHEAICVLNTGTEPAHILVTAYFSDHDPAQGNAVEVPSRRDVHLRLDRPAELGGLVIPPETPYGLVVTSDRPVVVQHSRMDTRLGGMALLTTLGYASSVG